MTWKGPVVFGCLTQPARSLHRLHNTDGPASGETFDFNLSRGHGTRTSHHRAGSQGGTWPEASKRLRCWKQKFNDVPGGRQCSGRLTLSSPTEASHLGRAGRAEQHTSTCKCVFFHSTHTLTFSSQEIICLIKQLCQWRKEVYCLIMHKHFGCLQVSKRIKDRDDYTKKTITFYKRKLCWHAAALLSLSCSSFFYDDKLHHQSEQWNGKTTVKDTAAKRVTESS